MNAIDIQYNLKKRGITQVAVAHKLGVRPIQISKVIHRKMVSDRVMRAVASSIEKDHREVFPEYYLQPPKRSTSKVDRSF